MSDNNAKRVILVDTMTNMELITYTSACVNACLHQTKSFKNTPIDAGHAGITKFFKSVKVINTY